MFCDGFVDVAVSVSGDLGHCAGLQRHLRGSKRKRRPGRLRIRLRRRGDAVARKEVPKWRLGKWRHGRNFLKPETVTLAL